MSEATDRPDESRVSGASGSYDADAWATACEEDLAAEKARRRAQYGPQSGSAAEELRRLLDAVTEKVSSFQSPLLGMAAQGAAQQIASQFVQQAKAVVEPVVERNPQVFDHLAAAGNELLAAYRSVVAGHEQRWTQNASDAAKEPNRTDNSAKSSQSGPDDPDDRSKGEHIDLD